MLGIVPDIVVVMFLPVVFLALLAYKLLDSR